MTDEPTAAEVAEEISTLATDMLAVEAMKKKRYAEANSSVKENKACFVSAVETPRNDDPNEVASKCLSIEMAWQDWIESQRCRTEIHKEVGEALKKVRDELREKIENRNQLGLEFDE